MIVAWIGYAMLCTAAVAGCAACVERLLGHHRFARRALWIAAMATSAVAPIVFSWNARPAPIDRPVDGPMSGAVARTGGASSVDPDAIALVLWAAATLSAATWLVFSQVRLRRALRKYERARIGGDAVIVSADFGPAVVGVVRPEVVLPRWVLSLGDVDLGLVLAHERQHIRARDPVWQLAGLAIAVALPWNLALWWQLKRLRLAIEIDCDSRVIEHHGVDPVRYGELLVRAHATAPAVSSALALVQHRSTLARRVDALLGLPSRTTVRLAATSALGLVVAGLVAFVPAPPIRRAPARATESSAVERVTEAAPVAVPSSSVARVIQPVNAKRRPRARQLALPSATIPPVHVIPNTGTTIMESAPSAAPLPARRFGTAVIVPRAVGGFAAVASDSSVARAGGVGGRAATARPAGGGGVFARAARPDTGGASATAGGIGATGGSDSARGRAIAGTVVPASGAPRPAKPPTP